jgi:uncharacterized repeat protein (TIGR03803 family)
MPNEKHSVAWSVALLTTLGLVFSTQPAPAQTFTVLHNFTVGRDGGNPLAGVTLDRAGNLYGTASIGGIGHGTVYQLKRSGSNWIFNTLYTFGGGDSDGNTPYARVVFGPNGTLYGTTQTGGASNAGTVFNLRPQAKACPNASCLWTDTLLHSFIPGNGDGDNPLYGDLLFDQAGNIYGTAWGGGEWAGGVVYELTPSGSESILYPFGGTDGALLANAVIFDNAGNLYGTTVVGGLNNYGTVFELSPSGSGWTEKVLYSFENGNDGSFPYAGLVFDRSGNLYGATTDGGSRGGGTVFRLTPAGNGVWTFSLVFSFTGVPGYGCGPVGTLVMDGAGNLYGATRCDGAYSYGNVFELTYPNWIGNYIFNYREISTHSQPRVGVTEATRIVPPTCLHSSSCSSSTAFLMKSLIRSEAC